MNSNTFRFVHVEAIVGRLEAIASRLEAIAIRNKEKDKEERSNIVCHYVVHFCAPPYGMSSQQYKQTGGMF